MYSESLFSATGLHVVTADAEVIGLLIPGVFLFAAFPKLDDLMWLANGRTR